MRLGHRQPAVGVGADERRHRRLADDARDLRDVGAAQRSDEEFERRPPPPASAGAAPPSSGSSRPSAARASLPASAASTTTSAARPPGSVSRTTAPRACDGSSRAGLA